jgi:FlaA1/EpsC-like NDP-sugar epimerase
MIRLSGYKPDVDIAIVYSGLRPGEKLFEELLGTQEGSDATEHPKILKVISRRDWAENVLWESVDRLKTICAKSCKREDIIEIMKTVVPTYKPDMGNGSILNW